jgi:hypothetical protein
MYHFTGAKIATAKDGDIEVQPAPGRGVVIRDPDGTAERLVRKSDYDGHTHGPGTFNVASKRRRRCVGRCSVGGRHAAAARPVTYSTASVAD